MSSAAENLTADLASLVADAAGLDKRALGRLVSLMEQDDAGSLDRREAIMAAVAGCDDADPARAAVFGFTGSPGAGKSSLIGSLCLALTNSDDHLRIAVIAVDPTSQQSGGALLGDRTRTRFPTGESRLYFRSQASQLDLGGVSQLTFQALRVLAPFFDLVFIETVGIGQSEIEIQRLADHTALVLQPLAGDAIQFMKCGIMEVPDLFVINKCDEEALARRSLESLRSGLRMARLQPRRRMDDAEPIWLTSATTGRGVAELAEAINRIRVDAPRLSMADREQAQFEAWLKREFGRHGHQRIAQDKSITGLDGFEARQRAALARLQQADG